MSRSCGTCTKCCEGHLKGEALGHTFYKNKPCYFVSIGEGCTVYDKRPEHPCKSYKCAWIINEDLPEWLKPSEVNAIIDYREIKEINYISVSEAGETLRPQVLSWILLYCLNNGYNVCWEIEGNIYWFGDTLFKLEMEKQFNIS